MFFILQGSQRKILSHLYLCHTYYKVLLPTKDIWWNLLFRTFLHHGANQMKCRFWKEISQSPLICKFDCTEKIWSGDPNPQNSSLSTIKPAHEEGLIKIVFSRNNSKDQCIFFSIFFSLFENWLDLYTFNVFVDKSPISAKKETYIQSKNNPLVSSAVSVS